MSCTAAFYRDRPTARDAQHRITRTLHFSTSLRFCEECNGFHLNANIGRMNLPKRSLEVLSMVGQGFTMREISKYMGISFESVKWHLKALRSAFGANSSSHLIAIAIAVKALLPNNFVPGIVEERNVNVGSNGQRLGVAGERAASCG